MYWNVTLQAGHVKCEFVLRSNHWSPIVADCSPTRLCTLSRQDASAAPRLVLMLHLGPHSVVTSPAYMNYMTETAAAWQHVVVNAGQPQHPLLQRGARLQVRGAWQCAPRPARWHAPRRCLILSCKYGPCITFRQAK